MPSLTQLKYIVAVDTYRHFGIAAKNSFVTQPTLSMQIRKAEEELSIVIFDRSKLPIIPTDIGKRIIAQARIILREEERIKQIVSEFQEDISGQLRVGIIPTLAPYLLPLFIGSFARSYPKVQLQIKELRTEEIINQLEQDLLDVGVLVLPLKQNNIYEKAIFYEEIKVYTHPEHPFSQEKSVALEQLAGEATWLLNSGHCFRNQMINLCALSVYPKQEESLLFEYESGSLETLQRLVDKEGGFTLIPELAIHEQHPQLRSLEKPLPLREVGLAYVRNYAKTKLLAALEDSIRACIPKNMLNPDRGQVVEWK